jgi:hypothetical protein
MEVGTRDALTDAIRYWERRRIVYNVALAAIVLGLFVANLPASTAHLNLDLAQGLFVLAVLANVAYCAAYPVDVFAQMSGVRGTWLRYRWILFVIGLLFAGIIARFIAQSMFTA